jgi:hypothetical protein
MHLCYCACNIYFFISFLLVDLAAVASSHFRNILKIMNITERGISPLQGRYLQAITHTHTHTHTQMKYSNASLFHTHDPSVRAAKTFHSIKLSIY